ncbi:hypothetical protein LINGRAHAP2_LOCUS1724, partial [Linum grandiflorum]
KKWREDRQKLWDDVCDKEGTKEENYLKRPQRINEVQWENFINYRMGKEMKKISEKNKLNRGEQNIYHTSGSKSFLAKSKELEKEWGRKPTRGELYRETHKGKKGFPNNPTRDAVMAVEEYMKDPETETDIGPNDAVGRLFKGKEHSGRVRGLGLGPVPSQVFGSSSSQRSSSTARCQDSVPIADFRRFS